MKIQEMDSELLAAGALLGDVGMPSPPKVVLELSRLVMDQEPDYRVIAKLVNQDAALSAKVIKLINSPLFGLQKKVKSINHALTMLGMDYFKRVVLFSSLREMFVAGRDSRRYERLWENNVMVANTCKKVAEKWPDPVVTGDLAYMSGLFHDCGAAFMLRKFADYDKFYTTDWPPDAPHLLDREFERYQTNHCAVGYLVARSWGLSAEICQAVRYHHRLFPGESDQSPIGWRVWAVLRMGQFITGHIQHATGGHTNRAYVFEGMGLDDFIDTGVLAGLHIELTSLLSFIEDLIQQDTSTGRGKG